MSDLRIDTQAPRQSCGICGGSLVMIRAKIPHGEQRTVCPTCLAERMDLIREMADRDYGKAYASAEIPKIATTVRE